MAIKRNYKQAVVVATAYGENWMVVYTGRTDSDSKPVFKVVTVEQTAKVRIEGREYWGVTGCDLLNKEREWFAYNDCVSFENWDVLKRLLNGRFGWMQHVPGMKEEVLMECKAMLREAMDNDFDCDEDEETNNEEENEFNM